jgi:hypothetical protein
MPASRKYDLDSRPVTLVSGYLSQSPVLGTNRRGGMEVWAARARHLFREQSLVQYTPAVTIAQLVGPSAAHLTPGPGEGTREGSDWMLKAVD